MKDRLILTSVLSAFAVTGVANAQTGSGTMGVTATVTGSINLTFLTDASGIALTGTATSTAALPFASVRMYGGTVPTNVTKTITGTTSFTLATPFDVRVDLANSPSTTYVLSALLATGDPTNIWLIDATNISASGTASVLTSAGLYATAVPHTLKITVPASEAAGLISNSIAFTAVGN